MLKHYAFLGDYSDSSCDASGYGDRTIKAKTNIMCVLGVASSIEGKNRVRRTLLLAN